MTLAIGKKAPKFKLVSDDETEVRLSDFAGKKVVLYFYPKDNTPGCTREACDFRDKLADFKKKGVAVLGVSRDSAASHQKFKTKFALPFPLLSDPEARMLEAYGAWGEKVMYGKKVTGVIRSTVLIDEEGKVAKVWPKVKVDGHADEVLSEV
ncbi:MAG TPA: thioredoxin-dependent thiol peroxidase [Myxococcales bacterium]|jgi:peroxiredoxin Q/BCP